MKYWLLKLEPCEKTVKNSEKSIYYFNDLFENIYCSIFGFSC